MGSQIGNQGDRALLGRDRELAELAAGLEAAVGGRGRLLLIAGEPGIGKTADQPGPGLGQAPDPGAGPAAGVGGDRRAAAAGAGPARVAAASGQLPGPTALRTNHARTVAVVEVPLAGNGHDAASSRALDTLRHQVIPATVASIPGASVAVTGETAGTSDFNHTIRAHIAVVLGFVLALAFGLLLVSFRSIVIPLKAVALNLLSVGTAYGILVAVFQHGWGASLLGASATGAITSWLPLFLFVILSGLSMDYHLFILSRVKELADQGMPTRTAVQHAIRSTAGTVTSAAMVMVAVFAIFITGHTPT